MFRVGIGAVSIGAVNMYDGTDRACLHINKHCEAGWEEWVVSGW